MYLNIPRILNREQGISNIEYRSKIQIQEPVFTSIFNIRYSLFLVQYSLLARRAKKKALPQKQDGSFLVVIYNCYLTSIASKLSSSINPSSSSPTTHSPTPAGVPVNTRSPILTEK